MTTKEQKNKNQGLKNVYANTETFSNSDTLSDDYDFYIVWKQKKLDQSIYSPIS